jgi:hypothetical protein
VGVRDDAIAVPHDEMARGGPDVDAVIEVRRVSDDALVFFVERVHRPPRECHPPVQDACVPRQPGVLPRRVVGLASVHADREPSRLTEVAMLGDSLFCGQHAGPDTTPGKVGDRVAGGFMKQHHVLAVGDVLIAELDAHPAAQWLRVQDALRLRLRCEEVPDHCRRQWALLPCQSHRSVLPP